MFHDYKKTIVNYDELNSLNIESRPLYLTVLIDNISFEFLINAKEKANRAIVFGSGAYNAKKMSPPIFNRHKWRDDFENITTIYYNDPTLYLGEINLGWGYGNNERHFLKDIADILIVLFNNMSIENKNTLYFGSSGGGFTSLMLASMLKGSKALVNNPQTIITNYYPSFVKQLYETVYPDSPLDNFKEFKPERISVVEFFKKNKHIPEIFYAQNLAWKHDVKNHMLPFVEDISHISGNGFKDKITMQYYFDKDKGHEPMSKIDAIRIVKKMLNN